MSFPSRASVWSALSAPGVAGSGICFTQTATCTDDSCRSRSQTQPGAPDDVALELGAWKPGNSPTTARESANRPGASERPYTQPHWSPGSEPLGMPVDSWFHNCVLERSGPTPLLYITTSWPAVAAPSTVARGSPITRS